MLRWMLDQCREYKSKLADEGQFTIEMFDDSSEIDEPAEAVSKLNAITSYCEDRINEIAAEEETPDLDSDDWEDAWSGFEAVSTLVGNSVTIHDFKLDSNEYLSFGYSDVLEKTMIFGGGTEVTHLYSGIPEDVSWPISKIEQKGKVFYISSAKVCEVDAVCSVPSLPEEIESWEAGERVIDDNKGDDEWQRRLAPKRINSIRSFIESSDNIIANTPILFVKPDTGAVSLNDKETKLTVRFEDFLQKVTLQGKDLWFDAIQKGDDFRPIWLIDGQHRIRGMSRSEVGKDLHVPIIIFPDDFELHEAAKIFAEINTLQTKLTSMHTLFMQHRFHIPSPNSKRDFYPRDWDDNDLETHNSRANHLSYEAAGFLASNERGPLYNRIRILDQNAQNFTVVKADQWVDFGRSWFMKNGPYHPGCGMSQDDMNAEIENYFSAVIETCNHGEWEDEAVRWSPNSRNKGLIQKHSHFKVLIDIFPTVWELSTGPDVPIPIPVDRFKQTLAPLKWVDWLHADMKSTFGGGGEKGRSGLRVWMEDAIRGGESYELDEVMSSRIKSIPGKGICSPPGKPTLSVDGDVHWPSKGNPVRMIASRPANSLLTSYWEIIDPTGAGRTEDETSLAKPNRDQASFDIRHRKWMAGTEYMDVAVEWRNAASPPTGRKQMRLTNHDYEG
jgi:DGQHR domain-containing protein